MGILQEILKTLSLPEFYFAMFRSATPVLLTTLGAMISSRSGTSNIALEGTMLISAFVGVVVSAFSQSAWIGFLGAVLAGFIVSNILAYFILKLNSNAVISGIALNTFASGGTIFVLYLITGENFWPQAHRDATMRTARSSATNFFILLASSSNKIDWGSRPVWYGRMIAREREAVKHFRA